MRIILSNTKKPIIFPIIKHFYYLNLCKLLHTFFKCPVLQTCNIALYKSQKDTRLSISRKLMLVIYSQCEYMISKNSNIENQCCRGCPCPYSHQSRQRKVYIYVCKPSLDYC